jgi:hypothetical protein
LPGAVRMAQRILEEMEEQGYPAEAQALRTEFDMHLKKLGLSLAENPTAGSSGVQKRNLPAQCPACLGPVRSDEVEWIDEISAQCAFCGSTLKAE